MTVLLGISDYFSGIFEELLGRSSGPLHLRLVIQPIVASFLAIRAGLRDARAGKTPFFWTFVKNVEKRGQLIRSGWEDIGKLFIVAFLIDTAYQLFVLHGFQLIQSLIVAIVVAVLPYTILRGLTTRVARRGAQSPPASRAA